MSDALNPEPLLRALSSAGVRHIIIGGFAVNAHGVIRPSRDLDIVPDPDPENLRRLARLLADLDARHVGLGDFNPEEFPFDPTRAEDLEAGANFRLETRLGEPASTPTRHTQRSPRMPSAASWTGFLCVCAAWTISSP